MQIVWVITIQKQIETKERKRLEKRLRLAEDSLKRLDHALRDSGLNVSIDIEADVGTLKCKISLMAKFRIIEQLR